MRDNYLTLLAIVLILSTIIQSSYVIIKIQEVRQIPIAGKAASSSTGLIKLCIGDMSPENMTTNCPNRTREGVEIFCEVNASDPDGGNLTFYYSGTEPFLNVTSDGNITIKTYNSSLEDPPLLEKYQHMLGNHSLLLVASKPSICGDIWTGLSLHLEIYDENDPPYFTQSLSDKLIPLSTTVLLFKLNDYFYDPERETLSYTHNPISSIVLTILGASDVLAYTTSCSSENVVFTATDSGSLSANSNSITITPDCGGASAEEGESSQSTGGDGGGGVESPCVSDWYCDPWTRCTPNGTTTKRCTDRNACNPDNFIYEIEEECAYTPPPECEEFWECSEWEPCQPDNTQTRECTELNGCDTQDNKPPTTQECVYEPTCTDGVQNQGETGVDCGGPCLPCSEVQVPGVIKEQKTIISSLLLLIIFILLSLLMVYKYFHKQINAAIVKVLLTITEKRAKRILLSEKDKKYLLEKLLEIEKSINNKNLNKKVMDTSVICREYFSKIFKVSLTLTKKQLEEYISQLRIKEPLSNVFLSFYDKISVVETKKIRMYKTDLLILIEELREIIHQTSRFKEEDIGKEIKEITIEKKDKPVVKIKKQIYNTYIAMHFNQLEVCKNKYSEIINIYEEFSERKKSEFYKDLERLFNEIKYLVSINQ